MQIYHTLTPAPAPQDSAVALGYFDGVHCGHRAVLGAAVTYAAQHSLTAAAFTFELPGNNSLKGGRILSLAQKHARVAELGIAQYWEPSFEEFRSLSSAVCWWSASMQRRSFAATTLPLVPTPQAMWSCWRSFARLTASPWT